MDTDYIKGKAKVTVKTIDVFIVRSGESTTTYPTRRM